MRVEKHPGIGQYVDYSEDTPSLNSIIQENIRTIIEHRKQTERRRTIQEIIADNITNFSGSMVFVGLHIVWFTVWFVLNAGWFGLKSFDPFPYGLLTMIVSLEAIFLSTFVLISQNRMGKQDQQRAELDLQINLLTERELTRALVMLDEIHQRLGLEDRRDEELEELKKKTKPDEVLKQIEEEEIEKPDESSV